MHNVFRFEIDSLKTSVANAFIDNSDAMKKMIVSELEKQLSDENISAKIEGAVKSAIDNAIASLTTSPALKVAIASEIESLIIKSINKE